MVGIEDKVGSLSAGKKADILFAEDKQGDITLSAVMKNGCIVA
jgi:imidazolonepropionase-like amidohydrolase